jgi:fluoroacetyl-CoA thioesterase
MRQVPVGTTGSFTLVVRPEHLASNFKDTMLPPVLSTPVMILIMENAALNALKPYLEPGEALHLLGVIARQVGRNDAAIGLMQR